MVFDNFFFGFTSLFPIFFIIIFVIVIGGFLFTIIGGIKRWSYNNAQPVLSVWAKVVSKRQHVSSSMHTNGAGDNGMHHHSSFTSYYVTFEVESGDRMELQVPADAIGMLVEGDAGKLTFQGTRYQGFEREKNI